MKKRLIAPLLRPACYKLKDHSPVILLITCYDLAFVMLVSFLLRIAMTQIAGAMGAITIDRDLLLENPDLIESAVTGLKWAYAKLWLLFIAGPILYAFGAAFSNLAVWRTIAGSGKKVSTRRFLIYDAGFTLASVGIVMGFLFLFEPPMHLVLFSVGLVMYLYCSVGVCLALTRKDSWNVFRQYVRSPCTIALFAISVVMFVLSGFLLGSIPYWSTLAIVVLVLIASAYRVIIASSLY
ncbi:hypothetical protein HY641_03510, partial [Candidatus Woesearchaeota archaeon]|nr:hypothetical protein [Candidatus Woesearchaeota archaeon]